MKTLVLVATALVALASPALVDDNPITRPNNDAGTSSIHGTKPAPSTVTADAKNDRNVAPLAGLSTSDPRFKRNNAAGPDSKTTIRGALPRGSLPAQPPPP